MAQKVRLCSVLQALSSTSTLLIRGLASVIQAVTGMSDRLCNCVLQVCASCECSLYLVNAGGLQLWAAVTVRRRQRSKCASASWAMSNKVGEQARGY